MAIFGWSKPNFCTGDGADKKAFITIFSKSPRQIKFQIKIIFRLIFPLAKPKYAIIGAVIPAIMSKFRPSKVINSGIALFRKSQYNTSSTGILTIFRQVRFIKDKLSINRLPFCVKNKPVIANNTGEIPNNKIVGGKNSILEL